MEKKEIIINKSKKLLVYLTDVGFSFNYASKMLRNKDVKVNGIRVNQNIVLNVGDVLTCYYDKDVNLNKFNILFEDENILIIEKFAGIETTELEHQILGALAVHRLDRNTQGLLVMAKNQVAKSILLSAFKNHSITKKYFAEVVGNTNFNGDVFKAYLVKDKNNSKVKIYDKFVKGSVEIKTIFKTIKKGEQTSIVEATLITGKTHQIRSHLAFLGHAIIGDGKYGKNEDR